MIFQTILTDLLICKDSFQNSLVKLQLHFSTGWNNAIGSFGAGTNGDDFYTRYIPYMNSLNLMVSTIANTRVKVLSTQFTAIE
jgi:hypothetical protein